MPVHPICNNFYRSTITKEIKIRNKIPSHESPGLDYSTEKVKATLKKFKSQFHTISSKR
jgi:hypothetical protein